MTMNRSATCLVLACVGLVVMPGCSLWRRTTDTMAGRTPLADARKMEDPDFPDERRTGMFRLVERDFGKKPPYTTRYKQIAELDSSPLVRASAIRALNISRDEDAKPLYISSLAAEDPGQRMEAANALYNMPDEKAIPGLLKLFADVRQPVDVRVAAGRALKNYPRLDVARSLAAQLGARDFSVAYQARLSLMAITNRDFRYDEALWLAYLTGPEKPF
jgi:hypothetical protein